MIIKWAYRTRLISYPMKYKSQLPNQQIHHIFTDCFSSNNELFSLYKDEGMQIQFYLVFSLTDCEFNVQILMILLAMVAFVHSDERKDASSDEKKFFPFNLFSPDTTEDYNYRPVPYNPAPYRPPSYQRPPMPTPVYNKPNYNQPMYNKPNYNQPMYNKPTYNKPLPPRYPNMPKYPPPTPMRPINILLNLPAVPATAEHYYSTTTAYPVAATYPTTPTTPSYTTTTPSYPTPAPPYPTTTPSYATPAPSYPTPGPYYPTAGPSYPTPPGYPSTNVGGGPAIMGAPANTVQSTLMDVFQSQIPTSFRP